MRRNSDTNRRLPAAVTGRPNRRYLPYVASVLIFISIIYVDFNHSMWHDRNRVIIWDVINYYEYLPSVFIYHDVTMKFIDDDHEFFKDKIWAYRLPNGNYANKMSMGMSYMYAPFFFIAHWVAPSLGYPADGYSVPYRFALVMSAAIYLLIGMIVLSGILLKYVKPWVAFATLISVVAGTNLFFYSTIEAPMTHAYSFTLFVLYIAMAHSFYKKPGAGKALMAGFLTGLIVLIRPTNIIIILFLLLFGITGLVSLKDRILFYLRNLRLVLFMALAFLLVWLPQLLYWKLVCGSWFFYSYGEERFYFDSPEIINGLFSYRKGWLLYTPMMALALMGIFLLRKKMKSLLWPVLVFTVLNVYIVLSWWSWWYGGSFGLRAFIESYAILSLPLAAMIGYLTSGHSFRKVAGIALLILLNLHSIFQTMQYYYGAIHWDSMTKEAYWETFGKLRPTERFYQVLDPPDTREEVELKKGGGE